MPNERAVDFLPQVPRTVISRLGCRQCLYVLALNSIQDRLSQLPLEPRVDTAVAFLVALLLIDLHQLLRHLVPPVRGHGATHKVESARDLVFSHMLDRPAAMVQSIPAALSISLNRVDKLEKDQGDGQGKEGRDDIVGV